MDIRQKLQMAINICEQFQFKRYFIQMIYQRLGVLEKEYHCSYEENKTKDYSEVIESLSKMMDSLQILRNRPKFDQYGKNSEYWESYRIISELFNEFVLRLKRCGFVYTCGVDNGILDLLMIPDTGFYKQIFQKLDVMHDNFKEAVKKWKLRKELQSELSLLFWYSEIENLHTKESVDQLPLSYLLNSLDLFSSKLENLKFDQYSLQKLQQEKSVINAAQNILTKYKAGYVGPDYIETIMNVVYANPSLKFSIFHKEKIDLQQSTFGQESLAISSAEPLYLQVVECLMDLSNVKRNEIIKITPKTIALGQGHEQLLKQPGVVYFGRQTNKNQPIQNDVSFPSQVNTVSRQQFQIVCQSMNYYSIICTSPNNPTFLKVEEQSYELQKQMIFKIGEFKFLITNLKNEDVANQHLDLSNNQPQQQLFRLNVNMENEPPLLEQYKTTIQEIDLLDKSQNQSEKMPFTFNESNDESINIKSIEQTIKLKSNLLSTSNQAKPFIEFKCIQGDYQQSEGQEPKIFREEVPHENQVVVITFGRDQRNKYCFQEKEISRFHCQIVYDSQKRWKLCERYIPDQKNLSSGGTFIQLQNYEQDKNLQYSSPCPLQKGMLIHSSGTTFKVI